MTAMNYANDEKLRLLRWLLPQLSQGEIVASELPFRDVRRKADLAIIGSDRLAVIEIKGPRDNLGSLAAQIEDYLEAFLEVDVGLASRFVDDARAILPRTVGIIELGSDFVIRRRRAAVKKSLSSTGSLHWLHTKDLQRLLGPGSSGLDLQTLRARASLQLTKTKLCEAAIDAALRRSSGKFTAFLQERSDILTLDDVAVLGTPTKIRSA